MFINITIKSGSYLPSVRLREERFSTHARALISSPITAQNNRILHFWVLDQRDFVTAYNKYTFYKFLLILHTVEEDTKIGTRYKTEWLANHLRTIKHFGETSKNITNIPSQIGKTSVFIYTMETLWYKLINSALNNLHMITQVSQSSL